MTAKEKAKQIFDVCVPRVYTGDSNIPETRTNLILINAQIMATVVVDEIISALKITTDHLTLNKSDEREIEKDFDFWETVKKEIVKINSL